MNRLLILFSFIAISFNLQATEPTALVKVYVTSNQHDYESPWQAPRQMQHLGTGFVIEGQRIVTNAHVASNSAFMEVKAAGHAERYEARVEILGADCDLAVLKVDDERFWNTVRPLPLGELPKTRDPLLVCGFPMGGEELSITEGIVSRIEVHSYAHSGARLLAAQIDAPINPGNSGGPVLSEEGKVVGVVHQGNPDGQNLGYMIPVTVLEHFLTDAQKGTYDGFPLLQVAFEPLENESLRQYHQLPEGQTGVVVRPVGCSSPARDKLYPGDVVTAIDGIVIANDGSYAFTSSERLDASHLVSRHHIGDTLHISILRDGRKSEEEIPLTLAHAHGQLVPTIDPNTRPRYFVFGGLVFQPLTESYLRSWGRDWRYVAPDHLKSWYNAGEPCEDLREVVILNRVLADKVNVGYQQYENLIVTEENGQPIGCLDDLITAIEGHKGPYHEIITEEEIVLVLDRKAAEEAQERLLARYHLHSDRS